MRYLKGANKDEIYGERNMLKHCILLMKLEIMLIEKNSNENVSAFNMSYIFYV